MWSVWLVSCDCGFHSLCPLMDEDKRLVEASWWEGLAGGKTGSYSSEQGMLSKLLTNFLLQKDLCQYAGTYMYTHIRTHTHTHTHTEIQLSAKISYESKTVTHTKTATYVYTYTYIHTHIHIYMHIDMDIYIHTYIYVHTYIHTYLWELFLVFAMNLKLLCK